MRKSRQHNFVDTQCTKCGCIHYNKLHFLNGFIYGDLYLCNNVYAASDQDIENIKQYGSWSNNYHPDVLKVVTSNHNEARYKQLNQQLNQQQ